MAILNELGESDPVVAIAIAENRIEIQIPLISEVKSDY